MSLIALIATSVSAYAVSSSSFASGACRRTSPSISMPGHPRHPLVGRDQRHRPVAQGQLRQDLERLGPGAGGDDPVVGAVARAAGRASSPGRRRGRRRPPGSWASTSGRASRCSHGPGHRFGLPPLPGRSLLAGRVRRHLRARARARSGGTAYVAGAASQASNRPSLPARKARRSLSNEAIADVIAGHLELDPASRVARVVVGRDTRHGCAALGARHAAGQEHRRNLR